MTRRPSPDKFVGAIVAGAVGDALGWPVEPRGNRLGGVRDIHPRPQFEAWRREAGTRFDRHIERIPYGAYSDDTQLTLAVARSLAHENWFENFVRVELPFWSVYEMGGGGAILAAAKSWEKGTPPWEDPKLFRRYRSAGANGAAMRVLPHCLATEFDDFSSIRANVIMDGLATHGHPRALIGAQLQAFAGWMALRLSDSLGFGELVTACLMELREWATLDREVIPYDIQERLGDDFPDEWDSVVDETVQLLETARQGLSHGSLAIDREVLDDLGAFGEQGGAGTITAVSSIYLASRHAADPRSGLLAASFAFGADADTLGAMTGGLLGCIHGSDWLGALQFEVQDSEYLIRAALQLHDEFRREPSLGAEWTQPRRRSLLNALGAGGAREFDLPSFGRCYLDRVEALESKTSSSVESYWLDSELGQTFRIKRITRNSRPRGAPTPEGPGRQENALEPPTIGLVLTVFDLASSLHFYEFVLGIGATKRNGSRVSFGNFALVQGDSDAPRSLLDTSDGPGTITVLYGRDALGAAASRLSRASIETIAIGEDESVLQVVCRDPDGNLVRLQRSS